MSDYSQVNDYSAKDSLASGNPEKLILGSDVDDEFAGISTAIASKFDSSDLASQAQAEAETSNVVLMTPLRVANWADFNAGMVGDIQALADPNADRILFWDDSVGAAALLSFGTGLAISGTNLILSTTSGMLEDLAALTDPGADRILGWDDSGDALIGFALSTGLTTSGTNLLIDTTVVPQLAVTNTFTTAQLISDNSADPALTINTSSASRSPRISLINSVAAWVVYMNAASSTLAFYDGTADRLTIANGGNFDFKAGTVTTSNSSANEVGFKGAPRNSQNAGYTLVLADAGKTIYMNSSGTFTIPANGSVAFPVGTVITFVNLSGGSCTIAITTDTLQLAGTSTTGSRTLASFGMATMIKTDADRWLISGAGLS